MDDRWAGTFSPGWYYKQGLKGPLVPAAKNVEANAKLGHRSKVCSLVVCCQLSRILYAHASIKLSMHISIYTLCLSHVHKYWTP